MSHTPSTRRRHVRLALTATMAMLLAACGGKQQEVHFARFEQLLFETPTSQLPDALRQHRSEFDSKLLEIRPTDPQYMQMLVGFVSDPVVRDIYQTTDRLYHTLGDVEQQLGKALARAEKLCPSIRYDGFYTLITGDYEDYDHRVFCDDHNLCVSIDHYAIGAMGGQYEHFGVPQYMQRMLNRDHIAADCMAAIARANILLPDGELTILDHMVAEGKVLYFLEQTMPNTPDTIRLRYSASQLDWIKQNTANAWGWVVSNQYLFTSDLSAFRTLMDEGPKTNALGDGSAPRIGPYLGLQIVKAYVKRSHCSLEQLLVQTDSRQILSQSAWRP